MKKFKRLVLKFWKSLVSKIDLFVLYRFVTVEKFFGKWIIRRYFVNTELSEISNWVLIRSGFLNLYLRSRNNYIFPNIPHFLVYLIKGNFPKKREITEELDFDLFDYDNSRLYFFYEGELNMVRGIVKEGVRHTLDKTLTREEDIFESFYFDPFTTKPEVVADKEKVKILQFFLNRQIRRNEKTKDFELTFEQELKAPKGDTRKSNPKKTLIWLRKQNIEQE